MKVTIWLKNKDGTVHELRDFNLEAAAGNQLVNDWNKYIQDGKPFGGIYQHQVEGEPEKRFLCLRFNDIAAIS